MSSPYDNFVKFYEENVDKILMPELVNYPLNYKKANQWVLSQCDTESQLFAENIIKNTEYVSFDKFINKLKTICMSYIKKYKTDKNSVFVLIIPYVISKSNLWVSLLAFKYLKDLISYVYYDITDVYNGINKHTSSLYKKNVHCVICDDCAYTGQQLYSLSSIDYSKLKYNNKMPEPKATDVKWLKWYENTQRDARQIIESIDINKFSVDLIIPYMSILANISLKKIHYVRIPKVCKVFSIFSQQIDINRIPIHVLNEFRNTFQYHKDISAVYFDHKIADALSTFNKIYTLAPLFNCSVSNKSIKFIDNCPDAKIPKNINIYNFYMDIEKQVKSICPVSFYKTIKYTFNKKPVKSDKQTRDLFGINPKIQIH
jgi:hypothetical protein